ncbi:dCTP deaminase [Brachyspira hyodysenteriae]|uniref:dCTP deaminase n=1 Tax=Brachyspira hyodysenteriae TaxID=159 RepID=UPI0022CD846B|nr:hypothetical protein [Brachyspira hyodysenteriae]MCZ9966159.1 hypothetical protein [Brachyspira hyodysenteriae]
MKKQIEAEEIIIPKSGYELKPNELYLGRTLEYTSTKKYVPMIEGRSSIGRLGIFIHITAGFGDVGFSGYWTLEIFCIKPIIIYPEVEIFGNFIIIQQTENMKSMQAVNIRIIQMFSLVCFIRIFSNLIFVLN